MAGAGERWQDARQAGLSENLKFSLMLRVFASGDARRAAARQALRE
jgi:hypothetical protein